MSETPENTNLDIAVIARDPSWRAVAPEAVALARSAAAAAWVRGAPGGRLAGQTEATVVLGDDALVRDLNQTYRQQDRPTNVLSFAGAGEPRSAGQPRLLGDVVLARETVLREAEEQGKSVADHLVHLVVHGMLHLLGYVHDAEAQAEEMESLEVEILADLGVADPYGAGAGGTAK